MGQDSGRIWFIYDSQTVSGPFATNEILERKLRGQILDNDMIWRRGLREWLRFNSWVEKNVSVSDGAVMPHDVWYVSENGYNDGPFTISAVINKIKKGECSPSLKLWTIGLNRWVSTYEVSEIMDALGISRRRHFRAPFVGDVRLQASDDPARVVVYSESALTALTLSEGGIGLRGANLEVGREAWLTVDSPLLGVAVRARAKVVYNSGSGEVGLQFTEIEPSAYSAISEYCRRFQSERAPVRLPSVA